MPNPLIVKRSLSKQGWLPNYHGAWAMVSVPILTGTFLLNQSAFNWQSFALWVFWGMGYFAFFAGTLYLKTRFRRGFKPLIWYSIFSALAGLPVLITNLKLAVWIPFFIPLILLAVWAAWTRRERGLVNDLATVTAACLMLPVAFQVRHPQISFCAVPLAVWIITLIIAWYFVGTVFYVKTNIRERNSFSYLFFSIVFHAFGLIAVVLVVVFRERFVAVAFFPGLCLVVLWAVIFVRACVVPIYGRRYRFLPVKIIGIIECWISLFLFIVFLFIV